MRRGLLFLSFFIVSASLAAQVEDVSQPGDVIFTEVMANPVGLSALPETEYIEIYNTSDSNIWLNGWMFVYDGKETPLPDTVLPSHGYAVLYRSGRDIIVASGALALGLDKFPAQVANTTKTIGLKNSKGEMIDEITYPNAKPAQSYERGDDGTWHFSTDERGGTPGENSSPATPPEPDPDPDPDDDPDDPDEPDDPENPDDPEEPDNPEIPIVPVDNSQPGDVIFTEIMANPSGLTALPETEYIEIFNNSDSNIWLNGWMFVYDGKETPLPDTVLPSGGYAVLFRSGRDIIVASGALALGLDKFPAQVANTTKTIGLKNSKGEMIDEITYPNAKPAKSYERGDDGTWHFSTDERGGTPGENNSPTTPPEPEPDPDDDPDEPENPDDPDDPDDPEIPIVPVDNSQPGDVIFTEIMANPSGLTALPETEYIEIFNNSDSNIWLNGWMFVYDGKEIPLPDIVLPSGSYAVLFRSGRDIIVASGALSLGLDKFPAQIANTTKTIALKNSNNEIIDEVTYPNAKPAQSYELGDDGTWHFSTDERGGTPGEISSPAPITPDPEPEEPEEPETPAAVDNSKPGDVIITEIMANPSGLTALPETEYVEIYNRSDSNIWLNGWVFVYDGKEIALPNIAIPAGSYAVLYRSGREISIAYNALSLGLDKFPSALANTTKTIGLKNSKGVMIDEVTYPNAKAAQSYERGSDGSWHNSTDSKGGTPGAPNSPPPSNQDPNQGGTEPETPSNPNDNSKPGDVIINEVMANPVGLTALPETEYIEIYNASGQDITLTGWKFIYDSKETPFDSTVLKSGGYAVLYRSGREISVAAGALALGLDKFPSALANTGKAIGLVNSKGVVINELDYPSAKTAKSYERGTNGVWHLSTDAKGGTPGAVNSPPPADNPNPTPDPDPDPDSPDTQPDNSQEGDVLINEVMANPVGLTLLPETEYIEIVNVSDSALKLKGWKFVYDTNESNFPDTVIQSGGYAVLYRSGRDIVVAEGALALGIDKFPAQLANTGKHTALLNSNGDTIDVLDYPAATPAVSYERGENGVWHLSTDEKGGTPGAVNSPATRNPDPNPEPDPDPNPNPEPDPADPNPNEGITVMPSEIVINEILAEPYPDASEYIEFYNRSGRPLPLSGLSIAVRKQDGSLSTHYSLKGLSISELPPDEYLVLTKQISGVTDYYFVLSTEKIVEAKMPALNNEGASFVLFRTDDEEVIDEVSYSGDWHNSSIKNPKGVSLERISPNGNSQDASNWASATAEAGYGTPGYRNSQYTDGDLTGRNYIRPPEFVYGMDYYTLEYQTDKQGFRCRAEVYTTNGVKVAEILNNQIISQSGEIRWDGKGLNNNRLPKGLYVFYAELYHSDGNHVRIKHAFLVH
ncbi:MAG: lamin tail domain-containing protein [Tannerella sp.]|jgi:hypothetical protein|nr:lamin tail domain-containing protein [Tannerella sp.]